MEIDPELWLFGRCVTDGARDIVVAVPRNTGRRQFPAAIALVVLGSCLITFYTTSGRSSTLAATWFWLLAGESAIVASAAKETVCPSGLPVLPAPYGPSESVGMSARRMRMLRPRALWLDVGGRASVSGAADYGVAILLTALFSAWLPDSIDRTVGTVLLLFTLIVVPHVTLTFLNSFLGGWLNGACVLWQMTNILAVVVVLGVVPTHRGAASALAETLDNAGLSGAGLCLWIGLGLGLMVSTGVASCTTSVGAWRAATGSPPVTGPVWARRDMEA